MRKKAIRVFSLLIVVIFSVLIYLLTQSVHAKLTRVDVVIGAQIDTKASNYLENVPETAQVSLDEAVFNDLTASDKVTVDYKGKVYDITINRLVPDVAGAMSLSTDTKDIYRGENLYDVYKVKADYQDDVTFEPESSQLSTGEQTITIHYFDQTYTQKVVVYDPDEDPQGIWMSQYDYSKGLSDVVTEYLSNRNISSLNVSFVYTNQATGQTESMNETSPMVAASTYKVHLALDVLDAVAAGQANLDDTVGQWSVKEALDQALIYSSNETATALINYMGGYTAFYDDISKYGEGTSAIPTIRYSDNASTAKYFGQVMSYLYSHQTDYSQLIDDLKEASPEDYYRTYLTNEDIGQKYGWYDTAINAVVIRFNGVPYTLSLFTDGLTINQFEALSYIINHWHVVNAG